MLTKQVTASTASDYKLVSFSMQCVCGQEHMFTTVNQIKTCSCGKQLALSPTMKQILIKNGSAKPIN